MRFTMRRVVGGAATYLLISGVFVAQIFLSPAASWAIVLGCAAAFFGLMGAFGITTVVLSERVRRAADTEEARPRWVVPATAAALGLLISLVALSVHPSTPHRVLAVCGLALGAGAAALYGQRLQDRLGSS
jgi:dolichol kinase